MCGLTALVSARLTVHSLNLIGAGNNRANELPLCQMEKLFTSLMYLTSLEYGPHTRVLSLLRSTVKRAMPLPPREVRVKFWIDVFCVPVRDESSKATAISLMPPTYSGARTVLMLDSELLNSTLLDSALLDSTFSAALYLDLCARILKSAWSGRSWTFQESCLPKVLFIQCKDEMISLNEFDDIATMFSELKQRDQELSERNSSFLEVFTAIGSPVVGRRQTFFIKSADTKNVSRRDIQLETVWQQMAGRSTTMKEDAHAIFANLLDFNCNRVLSLPINQRMKTMLIAQDRIPLRLLFSQNVIIGDVIDSPSEEAGRNKHHTEVEGLLPGDEFRLDRWVPEQTGPYDSHGQWLGSAIPVPGVGLTVSQDAAIIVFDLPSEDGRLHKEFCLVDSETGRKYWIQLQREPNPYSSRSSNCLILENGPFLDAPPRWYSHAAVGALLQQVEDRNGSIEAVFDSCVSFLLWEWISSNHRSKEYMTIHGKRRDWTHNLVIKTGGL